jgi:hypothetical protein
MAEYGVDLGARDHLRVLTTAYGANSLSPGVVRQDDVDAGRVGFYDGYGRFAAHQGVQSSRVIVGADFDHLGPGGSHFEIAPFVMWTGFRARQNFTGSLESSRENPAVAGVGDLFESVNDETALGGSSRFHAAPTTLGPAEIGIEPGVFMRAGHTDQRRSLVDPVTLARWDERLDAGLRTLDAGGYVDLDVRLWKRLRVSGGVRVDALLESIDDHLANSQPGAAANTVPGAQKDVAGVAVGPRVTAEYAITNSLSPVVSYGEGFRSLDAAHLRDGSTHPYSKVRSLEAGLRAQADRGRYTATVVAFETEVGNELVFAAAEGGLETERASTRRGVLGSIVTSPFDFLLASTALSVTEATFETTLPGIAHYVPDVPSLVLRVDATLRGRVATVSGSPLNGRIGVGYTFLGPRHLTDFVVAPSGLEAYNLLGQRYADDAESYVSNWQTGPGPGRASFATHYIAAPPLTVLGSLALYF